MARPWFVYILHSPSTDHLYVGITTDPDRRLAEHNGKGKKGARYTRKGRPWERVYLEEVPNMVAALKREYRVKRLHRPKKLALIQNGPSLGVPVKSSRPPRVQPTP